MDTEILKQYEFGQYYKMKYEVEKNGAVVMSLIAFYGGLVVGILVQFFIDK